jgi:hypothetical protein
MVSAEQLRVAIARLQSAVTQSFLAYARDVQLPVSLVGSSVRQGRRGCTLTWNLQATIDGKVTSAVLSIMAKPKRNGLAIDVDLLNCSDGYFRAEVGRRLARVSGLGFVNSWNIRQGSSSATASAFLRV